MLRVRVRTKLEYCPHEAKLTIHIIGDLRAGGGHFCDQYEAGLVELESYTVCTSKTSNRFAIMGEWT